MAKRGKIYYYNSIAMGLFSFIVNINLLAYQSVTHEKEYVITHYGIEEGLPTETVTDIEITEEGYLYVATASGLLRFDGFRFKNFSVSKHSGFTTDRLSKIYDLGFGKVLVQDQNNNLFRFKNRKAKVVLNPDNKEPISAVVVKQLSKDSYIATDESLIYSIDRDTVIILGSIFSNFPIWDIEVNDSLVYMLNTNGFPGSLQEIAQRYGWEPRRINPAVAYLVNRDAVMGSKTMGTAPWLVAWIQPKDGATRRFVRVSAVSA